MKKILSIVLFLGFMPIISLCQVPTENLEAYYPFNGNALDKSGEENHGNAINAIPTVNRIGEDSKAYNFNGTDAFIGLPDSLLFPYANFSISLWVKTTADGVIVGQQDQYYPDQPDKWIPMLYIREDGRISAKIWTDSGTDNPIVTSKRYDDNQWHHIVLRADQNSQELFVDNVSEGRVEEPVWLIGVTKNQIGTGYTGGSWNSSPDDWFFFTGTLDDVRIYSKALTNNEVNALYNEELCMDNTFRDTVHYYVSSSSFEDDSPETYLNSTDSLTTRTGFCDSVIHFFTTFTYEPNFYTDTLLVTVEDTLNIEVPVSDNTGVVKTYEVKVFPNPTYDMLVVDMGEYMDLENYTLKLLNSSMVEVWTDQVRQKYYEIELTDYSRGLYFLEIFNKEGERIVVKHIILQ